MSVWTVIGYERTTRMMRVQAETEGEAIAKAKAGDFDDVDTEPGPILIRPVWYAEAGWRGAA